MVEVIQGAATAGYLAVHGWWSLLAVSFPVAVTQQAAPPLIQALVGELAAFSMGRAFSRATGPLLMTGVVLGLGTSGWIALAAAFAAAALVPVAAAHQRANPRR